MSIITELLEAKIHSFVYAKSCYPTHTKKCYG